MAPSFTLRTRGIASRGLAVAALLIVVAAGCTSKMKTVVPGGGGGPVPNATITIVPNAFNKGMMAFSPDTVTVPLNGLVRMHNGDSIQHDIEPLVASTPGQWGILSGGASADITAGTAGTFTFVCAIGGHTMSGTLIVLNTATGTNSVVP